MNRQDETALAIARQRGADETPAQVWCDKCDRVAVASFRLTNGETAFRCSQHAWLARAPRGARCESGWTGDRCTRPLFHDGPHSNE